MIMIEGGLGRRGCKRLLANGHVAATSTGIASKSQILSVHRKGEKASGFQNAARAMRVRYSNLVPLFTQYASSL